MIEARRTIRVDGVRDLLAPERTPGIVLLASHDPKIADMLARAGHEIANAPDGRALHRTLADPFLSAAIDVVVAEMELDGCSALDALARTPLPGRPPIVLLSRSMSRATLAHARVAGAYVVLREPVWPEHLVTVVDRLVRRIMTHA